jgi:hypothetical protein
MAEPSLAVLHVCVHDRNVELLGEGFKFLQELCFGHEGRETPKVRSETENGLCRRSTRGVTSKLLLQVATDKGVTRGIQAIKTMRLHLLTFVMIGIPTVCFAGVDDVVPRPQVVRMRDSGASFRVTSQTAIVLGQNATAADSMAARYLQEEISISLGFAPTIRQAGGSDGSAILMGTPTAGSSMEDALEDKGLSVTPSYPGPEGYVLDVQGDGVVIAGSDPSGVFYGAVTLAQLLSQSSTLQGMTVVDHPDLPDRMIYLRPNLQVDSRADETVELMLEGSGYKMNRAVIADFKFSLLDEVAST